MLLLHSTSKAQRRQEISVAVQEASGIPNVIGIIDGTHIRIKAPVKNPEVRFRFACLLLYVHEVILRCLQKSSLVVGYCAII